MLLMVIKNYEMLINLFVCIIKIDKKLLVLIMYIIRCKEMKWNKVINWFYYVC